MKYTKAIHIRHKVKDGKKIPVMFISKYASMIDVPYDNYSLM